MADRIIEMGNLKIEDKELSAGGVHHRVSFSLGNELFMLEGLTPHHLFSPENEAQTYRYIHLKMISDAYDAVISEGAGE